jgi:chromosome segregation ATPase
MEQLRTMDARLRTVEAELKAAREAAARDISRLEFRATSLAQQLRRAEEQLAGKAGALDAVLKLVEARDQDLRLVEARDQEIRALRESTSWRVTAPLRRFKTTLMSRSR